ncbi:DUF4296 domain-containing protein [Elizabethkingia miricola]|nr:DUF4296 domain-containing protein [Elizabethkingia miricola]
MEKYNKPIMRKLFFFIFIVFLSACSQVDKPKKLISKDEMADIFVEMAIYDGALNINPQANMEGTSKYILQQHKITGTVFMDSYNYYISQKQMESIFESAEKKLMKKDPKLEAYIKKKNKGTEVPK